MYQRIPSIKAKDDFVVEITRSVFDPGFHTQGDDNVGRFLRDLIGFYVIMEGIFFYAGFAMMLALKRTNKMIGIGEQFEYIMRDESIHLAFGCDLINAIKAENPAVWNPDFQAESVRADPHRRRVREALRPRRLPAGPARDQRRAVRDLRRVHRRPPARAHRAAAAVQRGQPVPLDVAVHRPVEGEELLRDPGHRIPDRRGPEVGLIPGLP